MKRLSTKAHIALGQTSLLLTLLLTALFLGLVPDRDDAIRAGRVSLAEAVAMNSSGLIMREDLRRLQAVLKLIVDRNDDLLSAAVRQGQGEAVVTVGDHLSKWVRLGSKHSTDSQLIVPIWSGSQQWGQVELRFEPLNAGQWWSLFEHDWFKLIAFLMICGFVVFYLYLGRTLRHLDPNRAVPPHVRSALDTLAEGLLVLDLKGNVVLANSAFAEVTELSPEALVGRPASDLAWCDKDGNSIVAGDLPWVRAAIDGQMHRDFPLQLAVGDETARSYQVNCSPVLGQKGEHGGVLVTFDDVTALEESKAELSKSKEEADAANRAKSEFLANMSHEIRTPMNSILGFTEVLKRGYAKSEAESRKHLNTIHSSGKHLLQLINDVLDLSKVEAGRLEVETIEMAPHVIVADVIKVLRVKADEKGIELEFHVDGPIPVSIHSDPTRLRQILTNLVGNAIKFTNQGGVKAVLRLCAPDGPLIIEVVDSGVGMAPERLESVFEAFVQADSSVQRQFGGTGLGLAISRQFARAMGGDIVVRSEPGKGSVFTVSIDPGSLAGVRLLEDAQLLELEVESVDVSEQVGQWRFPPARVLVVDDGEENRELLQIVLGDVGLGVHGAENGQVGVDMAVAESFDVILMDMQMPVLDGPSATRRLRELGMTIPVIALTANAMKGFEVECLEAGCTDYLTKPVDVDFLLEKLAALLGGERHLAGHDEGLVTEVDARTVTAARTPLVSTLLSTDARYRPVVEKFVLRLAEKLHAMDDAWAARDYEQLAALGHWLKGSGGTVGFDAFKEPASQLEQLAKSHQEDQVGPVLVELHSLAAAIVQPDEQVIEPVNLVPVSPATEPPKPNPEAQAMTAVASMDPRFKRIQERFVVRLADKLEEIQRAHGRGDFEELAKLSHWLKGSAGTVGLDLFTGPARELEQHALNRDVTATASSIESIRLLLIEIDGPTQREAV